MFRLGLSSCLFAVVLLASCTDGDPGNESGAGGSGGSGGAAGAAGTGGEAASGGGAGDGGSGGTGATGGVGGTGGDAGTGGVGGTGGETDPNAITVAGQVFYEGGAPAMPDAIVILNGDFAHHVVSDSEGRFRFTGVVPPYDLTVLDSVDWRHELVEFKGLTRADPAISMGGYGTVTGSRMANVNGTFGGVTFPLSPGAEIRVGLTGVESDIFVSAFPKEFHTITWEGPASYSGSLVGVLTQQRAEGGLDFLQAGAVTPFEIEDGQTRSVELVLDQTIENDVTTIVANPGAYTDHHDTYFESFNVLGATFPGDPYGDGPTLPEVVTVPAEGARIVLVGFVGTFPWFHAGAAVVGDAAIGGETSLELPDEILLESLAPVDGEEISTTTPRLEWTPVPDAIAYEVEVESVYWDAEHELYAKWILPPTVTSLEIPDFGEDRFQLPSGESWWTVYAKTIAGRGPDELADPDGTGAPPLWSISREYMVRGSFSVVP